MTQDERIDALETRIAFFEQDGERLRDALDEHQRQILALERRCEALMQRIASLVEDAAHAPAGDERPPHY